MITDTHTHLYLDSFDEDREAMLQRALEAGVTAFYLPNIDSASIEAMLRLERQYPEQCFPMMGLHPCSVKENYREELSIVREWLDRRPFSAVGEIGIDLYWDKTTLEEQKEAFLTQVGWAKEKGLPIVIHSRESIDLIIELLQEERGPELRGIFHCFTGTLQQAEAVIDLGFYMGIGGVLTFKNSGLDQTAAQLPLERLVIETDAPYLAPVPFRGKRNESAYARIIAQKLADLKNLPLEKVAEITRKNAEKIFSQPTKRV